MKLLLNIWRSVRRARTAPGPNTPRNLDEAIGTDPQLWTAAAQHGIRSRLQEAASREWATTALAMFDRDPDRFLRLYTDAVLERSITSVAVWGAIASLMRTSHAPSFHSALARLGVSEAEWLASVGLNFGFNTAPNAAESAAPDGHEDAS